MEIIYFGICDIGLNRKVNQDSLFMFGKQEESMYIFVVADGMGGHENGELASKEITNSVRQWANNFRENDFERDFRKMIGSLQSTIEEVNCRIYEKYNQTQICGSTMIMLFIYKNVYAVISAGDSRIYFCRGFKVKSIMMDDVWENQREVREVLTRKQIRNHPNFGKLINAIGTNAKVSLSLKTDELRKGDTFMLCSDGLYKYCPEKFYRKVLSGLKEDNVQTSAVNLLNKTYEQGAKDNISVILVKPHDI